MTQLEDMWLAVGEPAAITARGMLGAIQAAARTHPAAATAILAMLVLAFLLWRRRCLEADDGGSASRSTSDTIYRRRVGLGSSGRTRVRKRDRVLRAGKALLRGTRTMGDMIIGKRPAPQRNPLKRQQVPGALLEPMDANEFGTNEVPLDIRLLIESMRIFG